MRSRQNFWRIVALIGLAHVAVIVGLVRWNASANIPKPENIVWVTGESSDAAGSSPRAAAAHSSPLPEEEEPSATPIEIPDDKSEPVLTSAKSEIELPAATSTPIPTPAQKPAATPLFKAPPKPSPRPPRKPRPRPSPRPTPKPTPKPKPRTTVLAKASPPPSPVDSDEKADDSAPADVSPVSPNDTISPTDNGEEKKEAAAADNSAGSGGGTGHGKGTANSPELAAYSRMLHDRLYGEWDQPTTTVSSGGKISTLVRVRIEKNGRISKFEIVRPSGNVMIDESVAGIGKHVTQVDPLPPELRRSGHYDVKINFELNPE